jgi:hypothetical protein
LLPRFFGDFEDYINAMARGVKVLPWVVRSEAILPMPIDVPDSDAPMRNRRIDKLKSYEPTLAVDEVDRASLDVILDADFNERNARIIADQGDLDGNSVTQGWADCVGGRRVLGVDVDEPAPLRDVDELRSVLADVQSVMRGRVVIVIKFDGLNCDHQILLQLGY